MSSTHIKKIAYARAASLSDSKRSVRISRKKKKYLGLVSSNPTKDPTTRQLISMVPRAIEWFARRQECLNKIICWSVLRNILGSVPTRRPPRMEFADLWEVWMKLWNSKISPKINRGKSWIFSRSKTRCYLALIRSLSHVGNSIRPIRSGQKIPISAAIIAATLPVTIRTPIINYPSIATEIYIYILLDVSRWID